MCVLIVRILALNGERVKQKNTKADGFLERGVMTKRTVTFTIGGEAVEVPEMNWDVIEDVVMPVLNEAKLRQDAGVQVPWWRERADDIRILAAAMRRPYDDVRRALSLDEAREVSRGLSELLRISGFVTPGEDSATSRSTETSTSSSPDSSPEGSLE